MSRDELTAEYQGWLKANPNVPPISADEALWELIEDPPFERPPALKAQIDWLIDFCNRWDAAQ
jgi:hypothetical protein